ADAPTILVDLWVASLTLMCMRITRNMVRFYGNQVPGALPVTTLTQNLAQILVLILGALVILAPFIRRLAPILTALGVGGLAVALALQDTLSNLFAGIHLLADKPIRVGDYVRLSAENVEGHVVDVGWRSTRLRMLQNNVVVVPNKRVAESIITNYDLGETRMAVLIRVRVDYDADAELVERLLVDEATR